MPDQSRQDTLRALGTAGVGSLTAISGCLGWAGGNAPSTAPPAQSGADNPESGPCPDRRNGLSDGGPTFDPASAQVPAVGSYFPTSMRQRPRTARGRFDVFEPSTIFEDCDLQSLESVVVDWIRFVPQGYRKPDLDRVVRTSTVQGFEGPISRDTSVRKQKQEGASVIGTYRSYTLLQRGRSIRAVGDGRYIHAADVRTKASTLRDRVESIIDRQVAAAPEPPADLFDRVTDALSGGLAVSGMFGPPALDDQPVRYQYDALSAIMDPVVFVGQVVGVGPDALLGRTVLAVADDPERYRDRLADDLEKQGALGYFSYSEPTVSVANGLVVVEELGPSAELLRT